jgi:hypothetical protein
MSARSEQRAGSWSAASADGRGAAAGTTDNNTEFESYPGCSTGFNVTIGQNDTSSAYTIQIAPSLHLYYLYNGSAQVRPGLPQGASFTQVDAGGRAFVFRWQHSHEFVVCLAVSAARRPLRVCTALLAYTKPDAGRLPRCVCPRRLTLAPGAGRVERVL